MKKVASYLVLLRGVNVGGKNKLSMAALTKCLLAEGFLNVRTHIASGNVILQSDQEPKVVKAKIEKLLPSQFKLDSELIKVLVLTHDQLKFVVDRKPKGFGESPEKYYSDAIFLIGISTAEAMTVFNPREGVDKIWPGKNVVYSQRLGAKRTQSRLSRIVASKLYQSMTIRSWNTTTKLLHLLDQLKGVND